MIDIASLVLAVDSTQVDKGAASLNKLSDSSKKADDAATRFAKDLERQIAIQGKSTSEVLKYDAALLKATAAQRAHINSLIAQVEAQERVNAAIVTASRTVAAVVTSISGVVGALATMALKTINAADAMNDLHLKTGIAHKDIAAFDLLAARSGTTVEDVTTSYKFLAKELVQHPAHMKLLGVTSHDGAKAMEQLAEVVKNIRDPMLASAVAQKALSRSGAEMLPLLKGGAEAIREARADTEKYGEMMERLAPKADAFNDRVALLRIRVKEAGYAVAEHFLPGLSGLVEFLIDLSSGGDRAALALDFMHDRLKAFIDLVPEVRTLVTLVEKISVASALIGVGGDQSKRTATGNITGGSADLAVRFAKEEELAQKNIAGLKAKQQADSYLHAGEDIRHMEQLKKKSEDYVKALQKETAHIGLNVIERKLLDAAIFAGTLKVDAQKVAVLNAAAAWAKKSKEVDDARNAALENNRVVSEILKNEEEEQKKINDGIAGLRHKIESLNEETLALTLTASQLREHIVLRELEKSGLERSSEAYRVMAERLREAVSANALAKEASEAARKATQAWERFTEDVERALTDALMRGFENGESFGQNFIKNLQNMLKSAALKIVVQAIVNPVLGAVGSALGIAGSAGSAGGLLSSISGLSNLSGGGGLYGSFATSSLGSSLGLSTPFIDALGSGVGVGGTALTGLGAALPWVGGALALGGALGLFGGDGDAMRTTPYRASLAKSGSGYPWEGNRWFSGDMYAAQHDFDVRLQVQEQSIIDQLSLTSQQIAAVNARLAAIGGKTYNAGMEHTDISASGVFGQIESDRLQAIAAGLGMSLKDLQDQMSGAAKSTKELAAQANILAMAGTLKSLDAVTGLRGSVLSAMAGIRGENSYESRLGGLRSLLAGETDVSRQVELAGKIKDLILDRYDAEKNAISQARQEAEKAADAIRDGLKSVGEYAQGLLLGNLSPLTNKQRLDEADRQYLDTLSRAKRGDVAALGALTGAAGTYLSEARSYSPGAYTSTFSSVQSTLQALGLTANSVSSEIDWRQQLLNVDQKALDGLGEIASLTEDWTLDLETALVEQTQEFEKLGVKLASIVANTQDLDQRIAVLLDTALGVRFQALTEATTRSAQTTARAMTQTAQIILARN